MRQLGSENAIANQTAIHQEEQSCEPVQSFSPRGHAWRWRRAPRPPARSATSRASARSTQQAAALAGRGPAEIGHRARPGQGARWRRRRRLRPGRARERRAAAVDAAVRRRVPHGSVRPRSRSANCKTPCRRPSSSATNCSTSIEVIAARVGHRRRPAAATADDDRVPGQQQRARLRNHGGGAGRTEGAARRPRDRAARRSSASRVAPPAGRPRGCPARHVLGRTPSAARSAAAAVRPPARPAQSTGSRVCESSGSPWMLRPGRRARWRSSVMQRGSAVAARYCWPGQMLASSSSWRTVRPACPCEIDQQVHQLRPEVRRESVPASPGTGPARPATPLP